MFREAEENHMDILTLISNAIKIIKQREAEMTSTNAGAITIASGASTSVPLFLGRPVHIPDASDGSYKTEIVVYDGPGGTIKINYWSGKDPREESHNHPWKGEDGVSFVSYILQGGYTETVKYLEDGVWKTRKNTYRAGDKNTAMWAEFHTVDEVLPNTVTLMVCGPRYTPPEGQAWGYVHPEGGVNTVIGANDPKVADPTFFPRFLALNPFRRK